MGCWFVATPMIFLLVMILFFEIPALVAIAYGALGGGIYRYRKTQALAKGVMAQVQTA